MRSPFPYIVKYPRSPHELPPALYKHAYGEDHPVNRPSHIGDTVFQLMVEETKYKRAKSTSGLCQSPPQEHTPMRPGPQDAILPYQTPSPFPMHMNAPRALEQTPFQHMHMLPSMSPHMSTYAHEMMFRMSNPNNTNPQFRNGWPNWLNSPPPRR